MTYRDRRDYIRQTFAHETPQLKALRESLTDENDRIFIRPEDGPLLQFLIRVSGAKKIVEIGTLGGYSALWMAGALPPDGQILTLEKEDRRVEMARRNTAHEPRIRVVPGDALDSLPKLSAEGPFDMVFIDADKIGYLHYLDWAEKNIRKGGLIAADNSFLFDAVWEDGPVDRVRDTARQVMRDFNSRLADPARYTGILLNTGEGMTVAVKGF